MTRDVEMSIQEVEAISRRELRRSARVWLVEALRLAAYAIGRVFFVPWCLIWPALTVWLIWWIDDVSAREALASFAASPARAYAWIYVLGATVHSLAIVGSDPYEWEIDRRVRARVLNYSARGRWIKRKAGSSNATDCVPPKGWERVEAGLEVV